MKLVVTIPAYNEEGTIASVIQGIPRQIAGIDSVEVLVVNDGSTDNTAEEARRGAADRIVSHESNQGLGVTFRHALESALEMGADIIVNTDADGQFDTLDIPRLIEPILKGEADFVTASRFLDKGAEQRMPWVKKFGNRSFTRTISYLLGQRFSDTQCGFRAYSREAALMLNTFGRFTYTQEVFIDLVSKEMRVREIAIQVKERKKGKSKIVTHWYTYGIRALLIIVRSFRDYQPMKFFGYLGLAALLPGLIAGLFLLYHWVRTGRTSPYTSLLYLVVVLVIVAFLFFVLALVADMMGRQRRVEEEVLYRLKKEERERNRPNPKHS